MPFYVLAMPIGHRDDISGRALEVLRAADLVLAEDTLKSGKLLANYGIKAKLQRCDAYTEERPATDKKVETIVGQGGTVVLITDAGSPTVCDPGRKMVARLHAKKMQVIPVPGACASVAALSVSGFTGDAFSFGGYPPRKSEKRRMYFETLKARGETVVLYEAARRLADCLEDMVRVFGKNRQVLFAHDMTKTHESFFYGDLEQLQAEIKSGVNGEITLVVKGEKKDAEDDPSKDPGEQLLSRLVSELTPKKAAEIAAEWGSNSKNYYYRQALAIKKLET